MIERALAATRGIEREPHESWDEHWDRCVCAGMSVLLAELQAIADLGGNLDDGLWHDRFEKLLGELDGDA